MADRDTALREVAELVSAVLRYTPAALEAEIYPVAFLLGTGGHADPETVEKALREALGLTPACRCGISPGAPSEVIPPACPVHGTPCEHCGGTESCKPGCGDAHAPVDSGFDADGTPWSIAVSGHGLHVFVGLEDVLLKGVQRDRFTEAVARAVMPGQAEAAQAAGAEGLSDDDA